MTRVRYFSGASNPNSRGSRLKELLLLAALLAGVLIWQLLPNNNSTPSLTSTYTEAIQKTEPQITEVNGRYLFNGTIVLARAVERDAKGDYNQPFSKMSTLRPELYDAWEADLECPVTTKVFTFAQQVAATAFNCRPQWLPALSKYVQFVSLAGNHTHDMGVAGFPETVNHLQKAGIQAIGNYSPKIKKDICEVVALPVRLKKDDGSQSKGQLPVAFCAWHYFAFSPETGEIETAQRYARVMPVFGFMHAGAEYLPSAGALQRDIARRIIDNGAEFVVGNSPHWVQDTDVYKKKLIVYSTGNFIFDQVDPETQRGASLDMSLEIPYDDNVAKWLALGKSCKARTDTCLEQAKKAGLTKVKFTLLYDAVASMGGSNKITQKATPALQAAVEKRLNWAASCKKLGVNACR